MSSIVAVTPDNQGPIVNIISWILLVCTCLATLAKVWSKWSLTRKLEADDFYLTGAMLTAIGWIAAISIQVNAGLGRHLSTLTPDQITRYQQATYASELLYILSLCLAKMAILHFMLSLALVENRRRVAYGTMFFNLVCMVVGLFAVAFQCPLPQPWTTLSTKCFDQTAFWIAFGTIDILVDVSTVVLPFFLLHDLQTTWNRKLKAIIAFGLRFLLIPMIIVRLVFLHANGSSADHPFADFTTAVATSVHVNFSVVFTCLPFLKPVVDNLQTGIMAGAVHIPRNTPPTTTQRQRYGSAQSRWYGSGSGNAGSHGGVSGCKSPVRESFGRYGRRDVGVSVSYDDDMDEIKGYEYHLKALGGSKAYTTTEARKGSSEGSSSRDSMDGRMVINQKTTISVSAR